MVRNTTCGAIRLSLTDLRLPQGLRIHAVEVIAPAAEFLEAPLRWSLPQGAAGRAEVLLGDVAEMLEARSPAGLRSFRVSGQGDRIVVEALKLALVHVRVRAEVLLEIHQGRELRLRLVSARALGANLAPFVQASIEAMNPLFRAESLPFPATISSVAVEADRVVGRLEVPPVSYPE
ncbi:MAG: hypothetical protein N2109_10430 [Fimbriimonadales bacterium]|nr:hypothetical protein [Fimbriimonadales bacterium]